MSYITKMEEFMLAFEVNLSHEPHNYGLEVNDSKEVVVTIDGEPAFLLDEAIKHKQKIDKDEDDYYRSLEKHEL